MAQYRFQIVAVFVFLIDEFVGGGAGLDKFRHDVVHVGIDLV